MTLKPCRFCGSADVRHHYGYEYLAMIRCVDCDAEGPIAGDDAKAAELWNTRADERKVGS
jgi:Lar family restriction alleviation protein